MACGRLTRGTHKDDDLIPCGTRLSFGEVNKNLVDKLMTCPACKELSANEERETKPS